MKKIKVLTSLVGLTGLSAGLIPAITSCSCNSTQSSIEVDESVTKLGVTVKSYNIVKGKESTIVLEIPSDKELEDVTITIGNTTLSKGNGLTISGTTITIEAEKVTEVKFVLKSVTLKAKEEWEESTQEEFSVPYTQYYNKFIENFDAGIREFNKVSTAEGDYFQDDDETEPSAIVLSDMQYRIDAVDGKEALVALELDLESNYHYFPKVAGTTAETLTTLITQLKQLIVGVEGKASATDKYYISSDGNIRIKIFGDDTLYYDVIFNSKGYITYQYALKNISYSGQTVVNQCLLHFTYSSETVETKTINLTKLDNYYGYSETAGTEKSYKFNEFVQYKLTFTVEGDDKVNKFYIYCSTSGEEGNKPIIWDKSLSTGKVTDWTWDSTNNCLTTDDSTKYLTAGDTFTIAFRLDCNEENWYPRAEWVSE